MSKPSRLEVLPENIPAELKSHRAWCVWRWEFNQQKGKWDKPPKQVNNHFASTTDSKTWTDFETALSAYSNGDEWDGIGFVFPENSGLAGIDWDSCIGADGKIGPKHLEHLQRIDSYTEISPSGKGLKTLLRGKLPKRGHHNKRDGVEIGLFDTGRYFCLTGQMVPVVSAKIEDRQNQLDQLVRHFFPEDFQKQETRRGPSRPLNLSDQELIEKACNANDGGKFRKLWGGDWSEYQSHSEGDQALCNKLAFWCNRDPERIDALFRRSGLYREKWENREDYRRRTIEKALAQVGEGYDPHQGNHHHQYRTREAETGEPDACEQHDTESKTYHLTDIGNGERFADNHRENVRFCFPSNKWHLWDGKRWKPDAEGTVYQLAKQTSRGIYLEASREPDSEKSQRIGKWASASESAFRQAAMLRMAQSESGIPVLPEQMDAHRMLLNVRNGVIDLTTGKLLPHDKGLLLTQLVDVDYNPEALCPQWLDFLETVMAGDPEMVNYLCRVAGYALTGQTGEQCFFLLHGRGQNGKSTFLNVLHTILADYATQTDFNTFVVKKFDGGIRNDIARLKNARMVTAIESGDDNRLDEQVIKQLTGNDKVTARFLHQEFFDYRPEYKIFLAANQKPTIYGQDFAIWRRVKLIPFTVKIPDEKRVNDYDRVLLGEAEGILNWMVFGCLQWKEKGLADPTKVWTATREYKSEMDVLADFLSDRCVEGPGCRVTHSELYKSYRDFCEEQGEKKPFKNRKFGQLLENRGFEHRKPQGYKTYLGLGLKNGSGEL